MIIVCQTLLKNTKILGITLFPFIILRKKELRTDKVLINHEKIHLRQQLELAIVFFYLWYILEFFYWYIKFKNKHIAYRNISFEKEAYSNDQTLSYLKHRKLWAFTKYFS